MAKFWTSDWHLGHVRIIELCQRPFADVDEMNQAILDRWNAVVGADDTVWVLGDVCMGRIDHTLELVGQLAGTKILMAGNHDRVWPWFNHSYNKAREFRRRYDQRFNAVMVGPARSTMPMMVGGTPVEMSHFPYVGDSTEEERYAEYRPVDRGNWLLHGHVHDAWKVRDRMVNVGVDVWDFTPVSESRLVAIIEGGPGG